MFSREYLFNPFMLMTSTDKELSDEINRLASLFRYDPNLPQDIAFDINLEADLILIYGEFISRLQKRASLKKMEADNLEDESVYTLRKDWCSVSNEKPPAMSYFEAQARKLAKSIREEQIDAESMLTRFKKAYDSIESKMNALKKQLEAIRFEVVV